VNIIGYRITSRARLATLRRGSWLREPRRRRPSPPPPRRSPRPPRWGARYTFANQVHPAPESIASPPPIAAVERHGTRFQPAAAYQSDILVSKFAFQCNLYRYTAPKAAKAAPVVNLPEVKYAVPTPVKKSAPAKAAPAAPKPAAAKPAAAAAAAKPAAAAAKPTAVVAGAPGGAVQVELS
jgi:hypothetical protein